MSGSPRERRIRAASRPAKIEQAPSSGPSVPNRIAHHRGRRDEVPNQELARELARDKNRAGIREIARNLSNPDANVRSDCVKVLYETGYIDPELISGHTADFLALLSGPSKRLVWGGMIALATVARFESRAIFAHRSVVFDAIERGSVITVDNGIKVLATVAASSSAYRRSLFPYLLDHLRRCRAKDFPQHAESVLVAVVAGNRRAFVEVLESRMGEMPALRALRIRRVISAAEKQGAGSDRRSPATRGRQAPRRIRHDEEPIP